MTKLFIGGFPLEMTELEVVQLVAPYADVLTIKLVRHRGTGICKGYGFIEVDDDVSAQNAIYQLNGTTIGDRELSLNIVMEEPVKPTPVYRKPKTVPEPERVKRPRRPRL